MTQSISINGAIIEPDEPVMPTGPLIVAIPLPVVPGCLIGRGRIVRTFSTTAASKPATFAITVNRYRIGRRDVVLKSSKP